MSRHLRKTIFIAGSFLVYTLLGGSDAAAQGLLPNLEFPTIELPRPLADAWLEGRDNFVRAGNDIFLEQRNLIRDKLLAEAGIDLQTATSLLNTGEFLMDQVTGSIKIISGGLPAVKEVAYSRSKACFNKGPTACLQDIRNGSAAVSAAAACASGGGWSICQEAVRLGQLPPASADKYANTIGNVMTEWERRSPSGTPVVSPVTIQRSNPRGETINSPAQVAFGKPNVYYPYLNQVIQTSAPVAISQFSFATTNNANGWNIYSISDGRALYFSVYIPWENRYYFYYPDGLMFYP